jgi:hypothetical protein
MRRLRPAEKNASSRREASAHLDVPLAGPTPRQSSVRGRCGLLPDQPQARFGVDAELAGTT